MRVEYFAELDGPQSIDFGKLGRQYHKGSKAPKTPPPPNYAALAIQQAAIDKAAAQENTLANRPDQYNDYGSNTWTQENTGTAGYFDQANYDKAMQSYQTGLANQPRGGYGNHGGWNNFIDGNYRSAGNTTLAPPKYSDFQVAATPGSGKWTQQTHLNDRLLPGLEAQQRTQTGLAQGAEGLYQDALASIQDPMSMEGLPEWGDASHQSVKDVQDATYALMAPELLRQRKAAENQLITQGVGRGASEAWGQGQRVLGQNENDAILKSILAGTTEAGNVFNRKNQSHRDQYNERVTNRSRPMDELVGLMGMTGGAFAQPSFNSFGTAAGAPGADMAGAAGQSYNAAMNAANAKNAYNASKSSASGQLLGGLGTAAGTYFGGPIGGALGGTIGSAVGGK